jgi:hypothetical protein
MQAYFVISHALAYLLPQCPDRSIAESLLGMLLRLQYPDAFVGLGDCALFSSFLHSTVHLMNSYLIEGEISQSLTPTQLATQVGSWREASWGTAAPVIRQLMSSCRQQRKKTAVATSNYPSIGGAF